MAFRYRLGRDYTPPKRRGRTVRAIIREHLREEGKTIEHDLARFWNMHAHSAHRRMYDYRRPFTPAHIDAVVEGLQLDEFDAAELHLLGAVEAGWRIDPEFLEVAKERTR